MIDINSIQCGIKEKGGSTPVRSAGIINKPDTFTVFIPIYDGPTEGGMKKELLFSVTRKDLRVEFFSGTGAGGQYRNKHQNCVRIHHPESGAIVTGQSNRERPSNIREAFKNLLANPKFKLWYSGKVFECQQNETIEERVEKMLDPKNLKIETKEDGKWALFMDGPPEGE